MNRLHVLDLKRCNVIDMYPYTTNVWGKRVQRPLIYLEDHNTKEVFRVYGRHLMWQFLDCLFPDNLPRHPVNDDIYCPEVTTPSAMTIVQDLVHEASEEVKYVILECDGDDVILFHEFDDLSRVHDIYLAKEATESLLMYDIEVNPFIYVSKTKSNPRPAIVAKFKNTSCFARIVDLGSRWYLSTFGPVIGGIVCLNEPFTICKESDSLLDNIKRLETTATNHNPDRPLRREVKQSTMTTREFDSLNYQLNA